MTSTSVPTTKPPGKAGRNLPLAIGVGVGLGGLVLASLLIVPWGWVALVVPALLLGVWELSRGFAAGRFRVPLTPVMVGTVAMLVGAYLGGPTTLMLAFGATLLGIVLWRSVAGIDGAARDITAGVFVAAYAPFLAAFSCLMLGNPDGSRRVIVFILVTVCSDIGGYAVGVLAGKHPMAPSVSPKKSWEGFAGSAATCLLAGAISVPMLLDGSVWAGVALGLSCVVLGTLGDLTESMLKRDLGIKDMGHFLPGHGGLMDRIDSLLVSAPGAWWLLMILVPVAA
ncbi:phosphatidate cytidylyltransferase [Gephyromycinifex aptenodytis]|uniref:phosphatidate cytidylyltransferase n=1 Tax=Gephyromycinifex aptenodytis TaxID=2716227 RepID=UPI001445ED50|nr:phosphatidate cytidylyltransferase [Gephyromycinifex aptenodytis]